MNGTQLSFVAIIRAKRGLGDEMGRPLGTLVALARAEQGNINYDLHRSNDDPDVGFFMRTGRPLLTLQRISNCLT